MSSFLYDISNTLDVKPARYNIVRVIQEELSDYVRLKMKEKRLSYADVANRSNGEITHGTVWNIANKRVKDIKQGSLKALAKGLGVPEEEVFLRARINRKPKDEAGFQESLYYMLFEKSKNVSPEKKAFIKSILKMIDRELDEDIKATN